MAIDRAVYVDDISVGEMTAIMTVADDMECVEILHVDLAAPEVVVGGDITSFRDELHYAGNSLDDADKCRTYHQASDIVHECIADLNWDQWRV